MGVRTGVHHIRIPPLGACIRGRHESMNEHEDGTLTVALAEDHDLMRAGLVELHHSAAVGR